MTTQFISRVERSFPTATNDNLGPGSYTHQDSIRKSLPGFAPFSSTSKRGSMVNPSALETPAPLDYFSQTEGKSSVPSAAFKSKSSRFESPTSNISPAVSYNIKGDFDNIATKKPPNKKPASTTILSMIKTSFGQTSVPSIPTKEQSFGYEEDPSQGKLIPQIPIKTGFSGIKSDTVGPLDYNPNPDFAKFQSPPKVTFSKDRTSFMTDILRHAKSAPGPMSYNTLSSFDILDPARTKDTDFVAQLQSSRLHKSSAFESKTKREPIKPRTDIPGPGEYYIPPAIKAPAPLPPELQMFSSSGPRFKDPIARSMVITTAPGQYNPLTSDFDNINIKIMKKKHMTSKSNWAQKVSFTTTESRFNSTVDKDIPGPCTYAPKDTIADELRKVGLKKSKPFGSTDERFQYMKTFDAIKGRHRTNEELAAISFERAINNSSINDNNIHHMKPTKKPLKLKYTSSFATSNNRFRTSADEPLGPPPTAYDTQPSWSSKGVCVMKSPTEAEIKREKEILPGPGQYELPPAIGSVKSFNKKHVFLSTTKREEKLNKDVPGPGSYYIESSLIRPSHNVYLSEKYN